MTTTDTTNNRLYYVDLLIAIQVYKDNQKLRLATTERLRSIDQGRAEGSQASIDNLTALLDSMMSLEKRWKAIVDTMTEEHPLWSNWLHEVKGVGRTTMGQVIGYIGAIRGHNGMNGIGAFSTVSKLWRYCGIGLSDYWCEIETGKPVLPLKGKKYKKVKGELVKDEETGKPVLLTVTHDQPEGTELRKHIDVPITGHVLPYNRTLKTVVLEFLGSGIIKAKGAYKRVYDERKVYLGATHPDWSAGRIHYGARRKMVSIFLSILWDQWRKLEDYPVRSPWIEEYGGHATIYTVDDFRENGAE
jgi:hypothetical protein